MNPVVDEPPAVAFTDQVTEVFVVPETAALNGKESPARMLALVGVTATPTEASGGPVPEVLAAQPARDSANSAMLHSSDLRIFVGPHREKCDARISLQEERDRRY